MADEFPTPAVIRAREARLRRRAEYVRKFFIVVWAACALTLIAWGLFLIYPPACPLVIGLLMWAFIVWPTTTQAIATDRARRRVKERENR